MTDAAASFGAWFNGQPAPAAPAAAVTFTGTPGTDPYANAALEDEYNELAAMAANSGRKHRLNRAAFNLAGLVGAARLDRQYVEDRLIQACRANGLWNEDGETGVRASIESGFRGSAKKVGARAVPELPEIQPAYTIDPAELVAPPTGPAPAPAAKPPRRTTPDIEDAEQDFWERASLDRIYSAALDRMCSPWAVLAHCAARALTRIPPRIVLPPLIGGPGSLNWFAAVATVSGGGKGAASAVARTLIPDAVITRNLGSGEGLIDAYRPASDSDEDNEPVDRIMFLADEIDTVTALGARTGSTLMGILRSGFSGETLGFTYRGRNTHIDAHGYRMTLVISVQPARGGALLGDHGGGTPQRFMWFPGTDPRISVERAGKFDLPPLTMPERASWPSDTLTVPDEARVFILDARAKAARGEQDAIDGHAVFCREKFAFALAVLDGRGAMNSDDWRLSGIAADISTITREWVTERAASAADDDASERGRLRGVEATASDEEKAHRAAARTKRIGQRVLAKLADGPMTEGDLRRGMTSRDRPWLPGALQALQMAELVGLDEQQRLVAK